MSTILPTRRRRECSGFDYAENQCIDRIEIRATSGMAKEEEREALGAEAALRFRENYVEVAE